MGLAYFALFLSFALTAAGAYFLLKLAWRIWNGQRYRGAALVPLLLALPCVYYALLFVGIFFREHLWSFHL